MFRPVKIFLIKWEAGIRPCWFPLRHVLDAGYNGGTVICDRCHHTFFLNRDHEPRDPSRVKPLPKWRYIMKPSREKLETAWGGFPSRA